MVPCWKPRDSGEIRFDDRYNPASFYVGDLMNLAQGDPKIAERIALEKQRQETTLEALAGLL